MQWWLAWSETLSWLSLKLQIEVTPQTVLLIVTMGAATLSCQSRPAVAPDADRIRATALRD